MQFTTPAEVTLANLAERSDQEVFDHVCFRMAKQGWKQAELSRGVCAYRDTNGRQCAAGTLMTDAEYARLSRDVAAAGSGIEFSGWDTLVESRAVPSAHARLVQCLQYAHDGGVQPDIMRARLRSIGNVFDLSTSLLDQLAPVDDAVVPGYTIQNDDDHDLAWSNKSGWVDARDGDVFTIDELATLRLPINGHLAHLR
ncbi:MAG TPA: hypothetical protein VFQ88_15160 [Nevskiaceae bacterium]|nr:hypothetical protein [Nevskiaceae bacterium]